ncbi:hypothetical protein P691DRAFT_762257 [Macrolepiota fuliginosa MF-IS2]|uniref:Uncharacterized protein n=1 Tax=Macrolepiota fuliginosa MF-IS2 TaxID=1400762 RepID=A0A9P5X6Z7_9AGAR|nr:hypothetical protein P691DRAFT_762257 [Macrolepiota fuliginosa MF-IS2]
MFVHRKTCWDRKLYLFNYENLGCEDHRPQKLMYQPPTLYLKKAVFVDTSLVEISHWMKMQRLGKRQEQALEELVVLDRGWDDLGSGWVDEGAARCKKPGCNEVPRCMTLPTLRILKVAGFLPDICVLLDLLEVPKLELLEVIAYGGDSAANRCYRELIQSFEDRCELLTRSTVILTPGEPVQYKFEKGIQTSLPLEALPRLEYV